LRSQTISPQADSLVSAIASLGMRLPVKLRAVRPEDRSLIRRDAPNHSRRTKSRFPLAILAMNKLL